MTLLQYSFNHDCIDDFIHTVAIDPAGSQYIDYTNALTHVHLRLASISLAKLSSKLQISPCSLNPH